MPRIVSYVSWAGYAVLLHEFALTFEDEVRHIWPSRWSLVKGIFLANRYGAIVLIGLFNAQLSTLWTSDSPLFCYRFTPICAIVMFISYASIHVLVLMRAWAVWGRNPKILAGLIFLFVLYALASAGIMTYGMAVGVHDAFPYFSALGICSGPLPSWQWTLWLPSLFLESGVFILTMLTIRHNFQDQQTSPIVCTVYRDGTLYFIFSFVNSLTNILVWAFAYDRMLNMVSIILTMALVNIAGQRLVLDLRKVDRLEWQNQPRRSADGGWQLEGIETAPDEGEPIAFELVTSGSGIGEGVGDRCGWWDRRDVDVSKGSIEIGGRIELGQHSLGCATSEVPSHFVPKSSELAAK
ncbi:hypothetical protein GLOTRDRAFT_135926 [Gloeophyllum trabeum ATCC 11539]|uniref:DUF6533 domain-containing protein n=1 Tax=Gloeophyllum trabeum (strain ATCC 11539 / FP-39264 / Madison 617) TaxID=670483 RepID=S7QI67_GLOTA|nr:uncharacterized protein GLOTRDRAFT_135926 [Gloeophyllum trabeum ATCC 11539]EPQ58918.1 hypothetical protein GLOTRDRAFT_135926 [Gloeophyllum trabeum ATCC 11539]